MLSEATEIKVSGPLQNLFVVEMGTAIQGPGASLFLRDMGAEVVKIEPPIGEFNRFSHRGLDNNLPDKAFGSQFVAFNRGKSSLCIDVSTELGLKAVHRLCKKADVFVTNYRLSAMKRLKLGYADLHELNPSLIYAAASGFGPEGPDADKAMLDGAAIARGGLASVTGYANSGPIAPGATIADTASAMQLALAIVTALFAREKNGAGQLVQSSALGAQLWLQMWELTHAWMTDSNIKRSGEHHHNVPGPYGFYETADGGHFLFAVANSNEAWDAFWIFADNPAEGTNPKWDTPAKRVGQGLTQDDVSEIRMKMREAFGSRTTSDWEAFLSTQPDIIFERVRDYAEVKEDPQILANRYLEKMTLDHVGETTIVGNLMSFSETPASTRGIPPELGAENEKILGELGFTEQEIESMSETVEEVRMSMAPERFS